MHRSENNDVQKSSLENEFDGDDKKNKSSKMFIIMSVF